MQSSISTKEQQLLARNLINQGVLVFITSNFYCCHHDLVYRDEISIYVTNDHGYVPFVIITVGHFLIHDLSPGLFQQKRDGYRMHVEQDLLAPPDHPHFQWDSCRSVFIFVVQCFVSHYSFVHLLLAIVMSVIRFTASYYPFGILWPL